MKTSLGIGLVSTGVALLVAAIVMAYVAHTISPATGGVLAEISLPPVLAGSILWAAALIHPDFPSLSATQMVCRVALGYALFFGGLWTLAAYNLLPDPDQPFAINGPPYWVTVPIIVGSGLLWAHSEDRSGLRKFSSVALGGAATLGAMQLLNHFLSFVG